MSLLRKIFAIAALASLWGAPAFATEHCDHATAMAESHNADIARPDSGSEAQLHQHDMNATAEEIPAGGEGIEATCKHHLGEACQCKTQMALSCGMEGCCIKADGPLSAGLSDRLSTNDDHALSVQTALPAVNGQMVTATNRHMLIPRDLTGPDPRPPSA